MSCALNVWPSVDRRWATYTFDASTDLGCGVARRRARERGIDDVLVLRHGTSDVARDAVQTFLLRLLVQFVLLLQHREHAKLAQDVQVRHCGLGEVEDRGQDGDPGGPRARRSPSRAGPPRRARRHGSIRTSGRRSKASTPTTLFLRNSTSISKESRLAYATRTTTTSLSVGTFLVLCLPTCDRARRPTRSSRVERALPWARTEHTT